MSALVIPSGEEQWLSDYESRAVAAAFEHWDGAFRFWRFQDESTYQHIEDIVRAVMRDERRGASYDDTVNAGIVTMNGGPVSRIWEPSTERENAIKVFVKETAKIAVDAERLNRAALIDHHATSVQQDGFRLPPEVFDLLAETGNATYRVAHTSQSDTVEIVDAVLVLSPRRPDYLRLPEKDQSRTHTAMCEMADRVRSSVLEKSRRQ